MTLSPYPSHWATFIRVIPQHSGESDRDYAIRLVGIAHGELVPPRVTAKRYPSEVSDCMATILTHYSILRAEPYDPSLLPFYFTFGSDHRDHSGASLRGCYCTIYANNERNARQVMRHLRGEKWCTSYTNHVSAGIEVHNLTQVFPEQIALQPHIQLA